MSEAVVDEDRSNEAPDLVLVCDSEGELSSKAIEQARPVRKSEVGCNTCHYCVDTDVDDRPSKGG